MNKTTMNAISHQRVALVIAMGLTGVVPIPALAQPVSITFGETSKLQLQIPKQPSGTNCNLLIEIPGQQPIEKVAEAPNYEVVVEITPTDHGPQELKWSGKTRFRGLRTVSACVGSGTASYTVNFSESQIAALWSKAYEKLTPEQAECVDVGLAHFEIRGRSNDASKRAVSPADPDIKLVTQKCVEFLSIRPVWRTEDQHAQNSDVNRLDQPCRIRGKSTRCNGIYAIRQPNNQVSEISRDTAIKYHFQRRQWITTMVETDEAKAEREAAEARAEAERLRQIEAARIQREKDEALARARRAEEEARAKVERERAEEEARVRREAEAAKAKLERERAEAEEKRKQEIKLAMEREQLMRQKEAEERARIEKEAEQARLAAEEERKRRQEAAARLAKQEFKSKIRQEGKVIWIEKFTYKSELSGTRWISVNYISKTENLSQQRQRNIKGCVAWIDSKGEAVEINIFGRSYNESGGSIINISSSDLIPVRSYLQIQHTRVFFVEEGKQCKEDFAISNIYLFEKPRLDTKLAQQAGECLGLDSSLRAHGTSQMPEKATVKKILTNYKIYLPIDNLTDIGHSCIKEGLKNFSAGVKYDSKQLTSQIASKCTKINDEGEYSFLEGYIHGIILGMNYPQDQGSTEELMNIAADQCEIPPLNSELEYDSLAREGRSTGKPPFDQKTNPRRTYIPLQSKFVNLVLLEREQQAKKEQEERSKLISGIIYNFHSDGSCRPGSSSVCIDFDQYRKMCGWSQGYAQNVRTSLAFSEGRGDVMKQFLTSGGEISDIKVEWSPGSRCVLSFRLGGLYRGTMTVKRYIVIATSFIVATDGKLLIFDINPATTLSY